MVRHSLPNLSLQQERGLYAGLIRASKLGQQYAGTMHFTGVGLQGRFIQAIHKTIFEKTFPAIAGQYRIGPLEPFEAGHLPPPPEQVQALMYNFVLDFEEQARDLKPVYQSIKSTPKNHFAELIDRILEVSAFAHWKLVHIHPFSDGNGRTARILGNVILQRYGLRPISIFVKDKARYRQTLHEADKFNLDALKDLIAESEYDELEKHGLPWTIEKTGKIYLPS